MVGLQGLDAHIGQAQALDMPRPQPVGRGRAEHAGLGIGVDQLGRAQRRQGALAAAGIDQTDVGQGHILDRIALQAGDRGGVVGQDVPGGEIAHLDPPDRAAPRAVRPAPAVAQAQEQRGGRDLAHDDVADRHVLDHPAIDGLQRQAARTVEDAVADGDVAKAAVGLRADLDAAGNPVLVGRQLLGAAQRAVQHRAEVVAADLAAADLHPLGGARDAQGQRALQHDGVVIGRVDLAVSDAHVVAAVDIDAVAVGVDGQAGDRQVVAAGGQHGEMTAAKHREAVQRDAAGVL